MSKIKLLFMFAGFTVAVAIAIPVQAQPEPEGECDNQGWQEVRVKDAGNPKLARQVDKAGNHDQFVCQNPGNPNQVEDNLD